MNEICQIGNFKIRNIISLFCSSCNKIINEKPKKCKNYNCKSIFCEECFNKNKKSICPKCSTGKLTEISIFHFPNIEELFFFLF